MSEELWSLETGLISDIARSKRAFEEIIQFHWLYYSELAFQRNNIREQLSSSLSERARPFEFSRWQRTVKYRYSLNPLDMAGSLVNPGGRFNIGLINAIRYPTFPALYIASDKATALAEILGRDKSKGSFTPEELALTRPDSITAVSTSGRLESVFDARDRNNLEGFVELIKGFKLSRSLILKARQLGVRAQLIRSVYTLIKILQLANWRNWPMILEVPAGSQVFGSLAMNAGIEGILYDSTLTGKACLAVFPQNFLNSSAYIELDDIAPNDQVPRRIDASTFRNFLNLPLLQ